MTNKEAIEILNDFIDVEGSAVIGMTSLREAIKIAIKAIEERPQGEWIPVSERLPKEEDYRPCYGLPDGCVMWQTDNGVIGFGWYYDSTKCWSDIYDHPITAGKVIAWMPLPEADKEADNETN